MNNDLYLIARWAIESYANNRDQADEWLTPLITIIGGDYDALTCPGQVDMGETTIESLAFLIGYLGYPCDAVYLTCTWEVLSVERDVSAMDVTVSANLDVETDETARIALMCWAHSIPTSETVLLIKHRHLDDHGQPYWHDVDVPPEALNIPALAPLVEAAHTYDALPIEDNAAFGRQAAMRVLLDMNGDTHDTLFYEPSTLLTAARNHQ